MGLQCIVVQLAKRSILYCSMHLACEATAREIGLAHASLRGVTSDPRYMVPANNTIFQSSKRYILSFVAKRGTLFACEGLPPQCMCSPPTVTMVPKSLQSFLKSLQSFLNPYNRS